MTESEPIKFRLGESTGRPLGGNVAEAPFAQALYKFAKSRGFESQSELARALGNKNNSPIGQWYRGDRIPTPDSFGKLLQILKPDDMELETIVVPYCNLLQQYKRSGGLVANSEASLKAGIKRRKKSKTAIGQWFEKYSEDKKLSLNTIFKKLDITASRLRDRFGLEILSNILMTAPQVLELSDKDSEELSESIARTIEQRLQEGPKFKKNTGQIKKIQQSLNCKTYNGREAGDELGITREGVRQLRQKYDLPLLLDQNQLNFLKQRHQKKRLV